MKKSRIIILALFWAVLSAKAQDNIVFDKTLHNFGTIEESAGEVSHTFHYTNKGTEPFVIIDVIKTCGCTKSIFSKEPLLSGKSDSLTVFYDPKDRPGRIIKPIRLRTNQGFLLLEIDGNVNPRPRTIEENYPFIVGGGVLLNGLGVTSLQVPRNGSNSTKIGVANSSNSVSAYVSIDSLLLPKGVKATVLNTKLDPRTKTEIVFTVEGEVYGEFSYQIPLTINGKLTSEKVAIAGAVVDNFGSWSDKKKLDAPKAKFETHFIRAGKVEVNKTEKFSITITNQGREPLEFRGVRSSDNIAIEMPKTAIAAGATKTINFSYTPFQQGYDSQWIRFIVNDPRNPNPEVRLVAEVM